MSIRSLVFMATIVTMAVGVRPVVAQQMVPYGPMGGYPAVAPAGYVPGGGYMRAPATYLGEAPAPMPMDETAQSVDAVAAGCGECVDGTCGTCSTCCCDCWGHCVSVFGEFLYLRPRNAEVAYGVPINGPIVAPPVANPIPISRTGVADIDYSPAFRFGFSFVRDGWSSLTVQYSRLEARTTDHISTNAPFVIRSLVAHPGSPSAAQDFLAAEASNEVNYDLFDVDYRRVTRCDQNRIVNWLVGVRYARLEEQFDSLFTNNGTESVITDIDFNGAGLRFGLEGEAYSNSRRWFGYGKAAASFMAGEFKADYLQSQSFDPVVARTSWEAGRIVPILDLEAGVGWQSRCGTWRLSGGYVYSAWYNVVKTDDFIQAVQYNDYNDLGSALTFDGLVARVEGRF